MPNGQRMRTLYDYIYTSVKFLFHFVWDFFLINGFGGSFWKIALYVSSSSIIASWFHDKPGFPRKEDEISSFVSI